MLNDPVAAAERDRFIIRRLSPSSSVAGGTILGLEASGKRPRRTALLDPLKKRQAHFASIDMTADAGLDAAVSFFLLESRKTGATIKDISAGTMLPLDETRGCAQRLIDDKKVLDLSGEFYVHSAAYDDCLKQIKSWTDSKAKETKALSLTTADLRQTFPWPTPLMSRLMDDLERGGIRRRGDKLILRDAVQSLPAGDQRLIARIMELYQRTGFESPRPDELPGLIHAPSKIIEKLLKHLCDDGQLIRVAKNVLIAEERLKQAQKIVVETIKRDGTLNSGDFKKEISSTRKYALAILDFLDARHITVRQENLRTLTPDYEKRLL